MYAGSSIIFYLRIEGVHVFTVGPSFIFLFRFDGVPVYGRIIGLFAIFLANSGTNTNVNISFKKV